MSTALGLSMCYKRVHGIPVKLRCVVHGQELSWINTLKLIGACDSSAHICCCPAILVVGWLVATTLHICVIMMVFCIFNLSENNCSTLQCREGFSCSAMGNTSLCLPVCGHWSQYPHDTAVAIDVAIILSATFGILTSIAVLVVSCIRWKHM